MTAKKLTLTDFRNIKNACLDFDEGVTIICGENAQGKTNILEALWFCSAAKSFRAVREREIVRFSEQQTKVMLEYQTSNREETIELVIPLQGRKQIYKNGVTIKKTSELIGSFLSVLFSPEHLSLIKDGPSERRRFIDIALCQLKPKYTNVLSDYNKMVDRRNAALKSAYLNSSVRSTLDVWDERVAKNAGIIIKMRFDFIKKLEEFARDAHFKLSSDTEKLSLKYIWSGQFDPSSSEEVTEFLIKSFKENREQEIREGVTILGPHRDDMEIAINGFPARLYASQGQQRSCVLSLKTAEAELIYAEYGEYPVFLFDDVLSELDNKRQEYIIDKIKDKQVIITCCEPEKFMAFSKAKTFYVDEGKINNQ